MINKMNYSINQLDPISIYKTLHPTAEFTLLSRAQNHSIGQTIHQVIKQVSINLRGLIKYRI